MWKIKTKEERQY